MAESSAYNSSHRALLQAFFARSVFTLEEGKPVLAAILTAYEGRTTLPEDITPTDWDTYIHILNTSLSPFNYEIRSARPQTTTSTSTNTSTLRNHDTSTTSTPTLIYALVNAQSDIQTQLATTYTPDEVAFIRRVLDAMFETHNTPEREVMAIKFNGALALSRAQSASGRAAGTSVGGAGAGATQQEQQTGAAATQTTNGTTAAGIKKDQAEKVLEQLVAEGWFARSRAGFLSLDTRGVMELGNWLMQMYNDDDEDDVEAAGRDDNEQNGRPWQRIKLCEGCRQIITVGQRCAESTCMVRLHDSCVATFFQGQSNKRCPVCRETWTGTSFVGERAAARDGGVDTSGRRNSRR